MRLIIQGKEEDPFIEEVRSRYVLPLRDELAGAIDGYAGMDWRSRFARVIELNAPQYGTGDCLPLGEALVFAGVRLGSEVIVGADSSGCGPAQPPVLVRQYQPRFSDRRQLARSYALSAEESIIPRPGAASRLHEFLRGELIVHEYQTGDRVAYEDLPAAYRAALLALYLSARVFVPAEQIVAFILGDTGGEELHGSTVMAFANKNELGARDGWHVWIRGTRPGDTFMRTLGRVLRNIREDYTGESIGLDFWAADKPRRRKPDRMTERACEYAFEFEQKLLAEGKCLHGKRKNGVSIDHMLGQMQLELGDAVRHYDAKTFSKIYGDYKKRIEQEQAVE